MIEIQFYDLNIITKSLCPRAGNLMPSAHELPSKKRDYHSFTTNQKNIILVTKFLCNNILAS